MKAPVGFIGIGIMGNGMTRRLLGGGVPLVVWNRSPEKCDLLKKDFTDLVTVAPTARDVVSQCEITFVMLSTPEACKSVYETTDGLLAGVSGGKKIIDCATLTPEDMISFDSKVRDRGGRFVEAPVSGSKGPAEQGTLIFLTAGDKEVIAEAAPYFSLMGKATHICGDDMGAGTRMKLVVNSIMGNMLACFSEGLHLTQASGLNPQSFLEIVSQGAIATPMFALKGPKMIAGEHPVNFPLKHAWKDIRFAIQLAKQLGVEADMSETAARLYQQADEQGLGDADFAAIAEVHKVNKK